MHPSRNSTKAIHERYRMQAVLSQVRRELAERYPTMEEQQTDEAKKWAYDRTNELRKAAGV